MKKSDYITSGLFLLTTIAGAFVGGFAGGYIGGFATSLLLFTTVGKFLFRRTEKRIDAALRMKAMMKE